MRKANHLIASKGQCMEAEGQLSTLVHGEFTCTGALQWDQEPTGPTALLVEVVGSVCCRAGWKRDLK